MGSYLLHLESLVHTSPCLLPEDRVELEVNCRDLVYMAIDRRDASPDRSRKDENVTSQYVKEHDRPEISSEDL